MLCCAVRGERVVSTRRPAREHRERDDHRDIDARDQPTSRLSWSRSGAGDVLRGRSAGACASHVTCASSLLSLFFGLLRLIGGDCPGASLGRARKLSAVVNEVSSRQAVLSGGEQCPHVLLLVLVEGVDACRLSASCSVLPAGRCFDPQNT